MLDRMLQALGLGDPRKGTRFIIHKRYQLDLPFPQYDARRPFRILQYLETRRLLRRGMLIRPRPVSLRRLGFVHGSAYLHSLENPGAIEPILGFPVDPVAQDRFLCFQRLMCGGTWRAAGAAVHRRTVMVNLGGGLHHAEADRGSGFCVFNDVAIAIASLRRRGFDKPILVVDLDLHDGDGTRSIFADDPTVHTFSIHNKDLGDTEARESTSIALGPDVEDTTYLTAIREHLPAVFARFRPGLVFYLAGSDPGVGDKLGDWRISLEGMLARDRMVTEMVRPPAGDFRPIPTVILLAGGYGPAAWRHGAAYFSWLLSGRSELDIPVEMELPVDHYRRLTRLMNRAGRGPAPGEAAQATSPSAADDDWGLREEEFGGIGPVRDTLFLGALSRHGIELALEELGLMDRLRGLGFEDMMVTIDLDDPLGHTLRISTGEDPALAIFEVRLRIDRALKQGFGFLVVEWLLIQDARSSFEMSRPLLPGQKHPGLGLLRDTAAVLYVVCERLGLDGLAFTPSHFHMASLAQPQGVFPDPVSQARFEAFQRATRGLRFGEASRAVDGGRIRDTASGAPAVWIPDLMILPVSPALKEHVASPGFRRSVAAEAERFRFAPVGPRL